MDASFRLELGTDYHRLVLSEGYRRLHLLGFGLEDGTCLVVGLSDNHGYAFLDNTRLLRGNLSQRVAQELCVVETDVGNDRGDGGDDIGTVQPSSKSDFNHGNVYLLVAEILESHGRSNLEERGMKGFKECTFLFNELYHVVFADRPAVDADALGEVDEMG